MNRLLFSLFSFFLVGAFVLSACGFSNTTLPTALQQQPTGTTLAVATNAQATLQVVAPTTVPPTSPPIPTETPVLTETPAPTVPPAPTQPPAPTATTAPVVTPTSPPTATLPPQASPQPLQPVNFVLAYYQVEYCTAWAPAFKIVNTGSMTLQSYRIKTKDNATKNTKTMTNDFFDKAEGCSVEKNVSSISYGQVGFIYSETFSYDPTGNPMTATITACTKDDLAGKCASEVVNFNP